MRNLRKREEASSFPHIVTRRSPEEAAPNPAAGAPFIQRASAEPLIKKQLAEKAETLNCQSTQIPSSSLDIPIPPTTATPTPSQPVTFAQATMSTTNAAHARGKSSAANDDDGIHSRNTSMGSGGGSKLKLSKRKKWAKFPLGDITGSSSGHAHDAAAAGDNASDTTDFPDVSGSDFEISRPASPSISIHPHAHTHAPSQQSQVSQSSQLSASHDSRRPTLRNRARPVVNLLDTTNEGAEPLAGDAATPDKLVEQITPLTSDSDDHQDILPTPTQKMFAATTADGLTTLSKTASNSTITQTRTNSSHDMERDLDLDHQSMAGIARAFSSNTTSIMTSIAGSTRDKSRRGSSHAREYIGPVDNGFDALEWGPGFVFQDSPQNIALPGRVEYTTVGSVINSGYLPQHTAPYRIQREGSGRRQTTNMSPTGGYQMGSFYQPRLHGPNPYGQFSQNPTNAQFSVAHMAEHGYAKVPCLPAVPPSNSLQLIDQEMSVMGQLHGGE